MTPQRMYLSIWIGIVMSTSQSGCSVFNKSSDQANQPRQPEVRRASLADGKPKQAPRLPGVPTTVGAITNPDSPVPKVPPSGVRMAYSSVNVEGGPYVAITYDDGPHPRNTPNLLDMLAQRNIKATFFVVGKNAKEYPAIIRRILAEGHEIGNHTWDHRSLPTLSAEKVDAELRDTDKAVAEASGGYRMRLMRPPYGATNLRIKQKCFDEFGYPTILWDVDPNDWKEPGVNVVISRMVGGARNGSILLCHDIHTPTITAMPQVLDQLLAKGFHFVTVSQLLNLEKKSMPVGVVLPTEPQTPTEVSKANKPS